MNEALLISLFTLLTLFWVFGPVLYLRWVWKRWASVRRLLLHSVLCPFGVFFISVAALVIPRSSSWSWEFVWDRGATFGLYGLFMACAATILWLPVLALWKKVFPHSFDFVWGPYDRASMPEAEDYRDP